MPMSRMRYENLLKTSREWKKRNPGRHAELARAYRDRNKEKIAAQNRLNYAIRKGEIFRQPCEMCGATERIHAHHDDYSKPLDVRWLCYLCHKHGHPVSEEDKQAKFSGAKRASLPGLSNPNGILSDDDVYSIRRMLASGMLQTEVAKRFNVSQVTVSRVHRGKRLTVAKNWGFSEHGVASVYESP